MVILTKEVLFSSRDKNMNKMRELTLDALRNEIQKGIDDLENGRFTDGEEVLASFAEKLRSLSKETIRVDA